MLLRHGKFDYIQLDQMCVEQQQDIACNLYYAGVADAYCEGLWHLCQELEAKVEELDQCAPAQEMEF